MLNANQGNAQPKKTKTAPSGLISTKDAAARTGYDAASLVRMARTGRIEGARKDEKGNWLIPSDKLPARGQRKQRSKPASSSQPVVASEPVKSQPDIPAGMLNPGPIKSDLEWHLNWHRTRTSAQRLCHLSSTMPQALTTPLRSMQSKARAMRLTVRGR